MTDGKDVLSLVLVLALIPYFTLPLFAWTYLRGYRETSANLWFLGTFFYALAAVLYALRGGWPEAMLPVAGFALVLLMLACMSASLRRETRTPPISPKLVAAVIAALCVTAAIVFTVVGREPARVFQLTVITVLDLALCNRILAVIRMHRSRALWFVLAGFLGVIFTNLLRIGFYFETGAAPELLQFSLLSNLALVANYFGAIVYSFGYLGFVLEKNREAIRVETTARIEARMAETLALDRERAMAELARQRENFLDQLARVQRAAQAGALSASIAHEINQPLASARLALEEAVSLHVARTDPARVGALLQRAVRANQRCADAVSRLRAVFGGGSSVAESRTIEEVLIAVMQFLRRRANELGVAVELELHAPVVPPMGAGELDHVLMNLLSNAMNALSRTGSERRWIRITARTEGDFAIINVTDSGPGVSPELADRLFDAFSGGKEGGLGLGLWLSTQILGRVGATIKLDDPSPEEGASFTVRIPLRT